jgi:hypothetical protein
MDFHQAVFSLQPFTLQRACPAIMEITSAIILISKDPIYPVKETGHAGNLPEKSFKELTSGFDSPSDFLKEKAKQDPPIFYDNPGDCAFLGNDPYSKEEFYGPEGDLIILLKTGTIVDMYI